MDFTVGGGVLVVLAAYAVMGLSGVQFVVLNLLILSLLSARGDTCTFVKSPLCVTLPCAAYVAWQRQS